MNIPIQPILLSLPSTIYIIVKKYQKQEWHDISKKIGLRLPRPKYLGIGFALGLIPGLITLIFPNLLPSFLLDQEQIAQTVYTNWNLSFISFSLAFIREAFYTALGEEIFFRGFLGGILIRKFGFVVGNGIQSLLFVLPHLLLLTISLKLWPLLLLQLFGGWVYGWLFYKTDSIIPSWLAHSLGNAFGALLFMR